MILIGLAEARDVDVKVHDMKGVVTGPVTVEVSGPGAETRVYTGLDDGVAPDARSGDRLYTARAPEFGFDNGTVVVRAGDQIWQGGFRYDATSDPVLLIGLEEGGFAAASTKEVMYVAQDRMPPPNARAPADGAAAMPQKAPARAITPDGLWMGWGFAALFSAGLGALAYAGAGRTPRLPPVVGETRATASGRGPYTPSADLTDLFLGPTLTPAAAQIAEGRWTPTEIALAALRIRGYGRIVVTDSSLVDAEGDAYAALAEALRGIADLWWVETRAPDRA